MRIRHIFYRLLSLLLTALLWTFRGVRGILRAATWIIRHLLGAAFFALCRFFLRNLIVPVYQVTLIFRTRLKKTLAASRSAILHPLTTRHAIHAVVVLVMFFVVANNVYGREIAADEYGQQSVAFRLVDTGEIDIVETVETVSVNSSNIYDGSALASRQTLEDEADILNENSGLSQGAIIKPSLAGSDSSVAFDTIEYHIVEGGETISQIAERYSVTQDTILKENNLASGDLIRPGQKLTILITDSGQAASHRIAKGENLEEIAKKYGVSVDSIVAFNELADASDIEIGQVLIIDGGKKPDPPKPVIAAEPNPKPRKGLGKVGDLFSPKKTTEVGTSRGGLVWPARSRRVNRGVKASHVALDIDGDIGNPLFASDSGRVIKAGNGRGYGIHVVIDHGNGLNTLYAHMRTTYVKAGQSVNRGEAIGEVGLTGNTTGPHVHYETRINGKKVNPWNYFK